MPAEQIGDYLIEYSGERLKIGRAWGAYLTVYLAASGTVHRTRILARHRVGLDTVYLSQEAAEARAREAGMAKLGRSSQKD